MSFFLFRGRTLVTKPSNCKASHYLNAHYRQRGIDGPALRRRNLNTMATSSNLQLFVIWAPDYVDEDAFSRRLAVRDQHLARAEENKKKGYVTSKLSYTLLDPLDN